MIPPLAYRCEILLVLFCNNFDTINNIDNNITTTTNNNNNNNNTLTNNEINNIGNNELNNINIVNDTKTTSTMAAMTPATTTLQKQY